MLAQFNRATDFGAFDLSLLALRTGNPAVARGSFTFQGETYDSRWILPLSQGGVAQNLTLLGDGFALSGGAFVAGTVGAIRLLDGSGTQTVFALWDLTVQATAVETALRSAGRADDRALLNQMLAGNDRLVLSNQADRAYGATGNDTLFGNRGADALSGNNGNDWLYGGDGNDTLSGQSNNDRLFGGTGNDSLDGGTGNDVLTGGAGADAFVFTSNDGNDVIRDFQDDVDRIDINILRPGTWQVDLQPQDGDTILTIFRVSDPSEVLNLRIVIQNINPTDVEDDILI